MVKDILLNIDASDVRFTDKSDSAAVYYETIWGNVFDTDTANILYLNIVVPQAQSKLLTFDGNGDFSCNIQTAYHPEDRDFYVRFVILQNGEYKQFSSSSLPSSARAKSYFDDFYNLQAISACQLLNIDENGYYEVVIHNSDTLSAEIYSSENSDLLYGESDDQSAKLLSLCAPGKNYRFPITGVGITDYINTVIDHTNLSERMISEFKSNSTPVISASFDNTSGNLKVEQSSEEEQDLDFEDLTDSDYEIIQAADDAFIRKYTLSTADTDITASDIILELASLVDVYAIYELEDVEKTVLQDTKLPGYALVFDTNTNGECGFTGLKNSNFVAVSAELNPGDLIYLNNRKQLSYTDGSTEKQATVPFVFTSPDKTFNGSATNDDSYYKKVAVTSNKTTYDECAIIMKKCKLFYSCLVDDLNNAKNCIYKIEVNNLSVKNLLVLVNDHITGRLIAYTSANTDISSIKQNQEKSQLIISKED